MDAGEDGMKVLSNIWGWESESEPKSFAGGEKMRTWVLMSRTCPG